MRRRSSTHQDTGVAIPVEVDGLGPAWLGRTLGADVVGVDVLAAHSGTTGRARLRLTYGRSAGGPETVFVKLQPFGARQREFLRLVGIGVSEARFYATLGGGVPVRIPRVLHAEHDDGDGFVMVLEDLVAAGCTFPSPRDPDVAERAASTVEEMARLHAAFWESARFEDGGDLAWVPARAGHPKGAENVGTELVGRVGQRLDEHLNPAARRLVQLYVAHAPAILDLWDEGERTLIHGDAHMGNLFNDGPRTGFLDWAMVAHAPGARDVAYFGCASLPPEVRRAGETELLARYRATLATGGVERDARTLFEQYRLFSVTGWIASATTALMGSRWQAPDVGFGGLARANAAIDDLDAVGLLEERLGL